MCQGHRRLGDMSLFFIVLGILAACMIGMAVGIIIRNKGFTTCGRAAAAAMEEGDGKCSVCGVSAGGGCKNKKSG